MRLSRPSFRLFLSFALVALALLFALGYAPTAAQDTEATDEPGGEAMTEAPTETPTALPTDTPVPTPTDIPTATPTEMPTDVPTATSTETPTSSPESTEAASPGEQPSPETATPTAETAAPTAAEPLPAPVYSETFDGGDLSNWRLGAGWTLAPNEGGQALQLAGTTAAAQFVGDGLNNVVVQARFQSANGAAQLLARQSAAGSYSASLSPNGLVELARSGQVVGAASTAASGAGQWRLLRLSVMNGALRVSVDGVEVIALADDAPLPPGAVSFAGVFPAPDGVQVYTLMVDDVSIWRAETDGVPASTPTETPAETEAPQAVTETPTTDASRVIVVPEVVMLNAMPTADTSPEVTPEATEEIMALASAVEAPLASPCAGTDGPNPPSLSSPSNGSATTDTTPTLRWNSASGANRYCLEITRLSDNAVVLTQETSSRSFTPSVSLMQGAYSWRVSARNSAGTWGALSSPHSLTINILRSPSNNAVTTDTTPTFSWQTVSGATRYQLQVDDDPNFGSPINFIISRGGTGSFTPSSSARLPTNRYYWRVNPDMTSTGDDFVPSPVSWILTVTPALPNAPSLANPANNSRTNDNTPDLRWNASSSSAGMPYQYQLVVDNNSNFGSPVLNVTINGTSLTYPPGITLADGKYYWRVRTVNALGAAGSWSSSRNFTVDTTPPAVPSLRSPSNGSATTDTTPTLRWNSASGASRYEVRLDTASSPVTIVTNTSSTSYTPSVPLLYLTYYWQVRAIDSAGNVSNWSAVRSVIVNSSSSAAPVPNRYATDTPTLTWGPVSWATGYTVQVDNNSNFGSPEVNTGLAAGTLSLTLSPMPDGRYYWRVRARNGSSNGSWSSTGTFTVES